MSATPDNVIRIDGYRTRPPTANRQCANCGSEWFRLENLAAEHGAAAHGSVIPDAESPRRITGYSGTLGRLECNQPAGTP